VVLQADRRGDVEHRHEEAGQREHDDERAADGRQREHDRRTDRVDEQDRDLELALGDPAGQDRVGRIQSPDVVLGVDAAGRVEVVIDHVVRRVGEDQADHGEQEQTPVDRGAA
jgi:hypothetical protein